MNFYQHGMRDVAVGRVIDRKEDSNPLNNFKHGKTLKHTSAPSLVRISASRRQPNNNAESSKASSWNSDE